MSKTSSIAIIRSEFDRLPSRLRGARRGLLGLQRQTIRMTKHRPMRTLLGAFAVGFVISRLARLAGA